MPSKEETEEKWLKIPTAEELYNQFPHTVVGYISKGNCIAIAQVLAKLHVKAALEAAADKVEIIDIGSVNSNGENCEYYEVDKNSILNAYHENLIV